MKIENITSVHNYSMLHITCSTKSQMTLCPSVPDMPINWKGQMYWDIDFRGSLGKGLKVFKVNLTWNASIIMGVSACPHCDAHYWLVFCFLFSYIFHNIKWHPAVSFCCCWFFFFVFFKTFFVLFYIHSFDWMYLQLNSMKSKEQCYCTSPARGLAEQ